jgi:hypothetical protein
VDQAVSLQGIAKQYFSQARYGAAARATFDARVHADRAVALLKGLPDPGRVQDQLARTREVLDRARDRLAQCDLPAPREMLRTALEMQTRAELAYSETRYLAALQLTMSARERALRALRLCNVADNAHDAAERALRVTDDVITRAQDAVSAHGDEPAHQALARAVSFQAEARREFMAEHFEPSLRLTQSARTFAVRAIRLSGGSI